MRKRKSILVVLVILVLLTACGDDDWEVASKYTDEWTNFAGERYTVYLVMCKSSREVGGRIAYTYEEIELTEAEWDDIEVGDDC